MAARRVYFAAVNADSFTLPVDFDASQPLNVTCVGGGGGGARVGAASGGAGGGGGGALARGSFSGLKPGQVIYFSIGSGGTGASTASTNGGNGSDTWVNISTNSAPGSSSAGVLAKGGSGGSGATGGAGGAAGSSFGNTNTSSGGAGGAGGTSNGSGGGGGGSAGKWDGSSGYGTGGDGGNGFNVAGDGGGGGGGGVNGGGGSSFSINGGVGGLSYNSVNALGGTSPTQGNSGGGGGAGNGRNNNSTSAYTGATGGGVNTLSGTSLTYLSGAWTYGFSGGGGGGGGGTNNSSTTGGAGGFGGSYGGGGGGGGSGTTNAGNGGPGEFGVVVFDYTSKETMLPTSAISLNNIQTYFGGSNPAAITEYYGGTSLVTSLARNNADTLIPTSGQISMNNFRGAPFKLYREVQHGYQFIVIDVKTFETRIGYESAAGMGAVDSTAFTLSGGSGVAITKLYHSNFSSDITFEVSCTSLPSNSGWSHIIFPQASFARSAATFTTSGSTMARWTWSSISNPLQNGNTIYPVIGVDSIIYFV